MKDSDCECDNTNGDHTQCEFRRAEEPIRQRILNPFVEVLKEFVEREAKGDERRTSPDPGHERPFLCKKRLMKSQIPLVNHAKKHNEWEVAGYIRRNAERQREISGPEHLFGPSLYIYILREVLCPQLCT